MRVFKKGDICGDTPPTPTASGIALTPFLLYFFQKYLFVIPEDNG